MAKIRNKKTGEIDDVDISDPRVQQILQNNENLELVNDAPDIQKRMLERFGLGATGHMASSPNLSLPNLGMAAASGLLNVALSDKEKDITPGEVGTTLTGGLIGKGVSKGLDKLPIKNEYVKAGLQSLGNLFTGGSLNAAQKASEGARGKELLPNSTSEQLMLALQGGMPWLAPLLNKFTSMGPAKKAANLREQQTGENVPARKLQEADSNTPGAKVFEEPINYQTKYRGDMQANVTQLEEYEQKIDQALLDNKGKDIQKQLQLLDAKRQVSQQKLQAQSHLADIEDQQSELQKRQVTDQSKIETLQSKNKQQIAKNKVETLRKNDILYQLDSTIKDLDSQISGHESILKESKVPIPEVQQKIDMLKAQRQGLIQQQSDLHAQISNIKAQDILSRGGISTPDNENAAIKALKGNLTQQDKYKLDLQRQRQQAQNAIKALEVPFDDLSFQRQQNKLDALPLEKEASKVAFQIKQARDAAKNGGVLNPSAKKILEGASTAEQVFQNILDSSTAKDVTEFMNYMEKNHGISNDQFRESIMQEVFKRAYDPATGGYTKFNEISKSPQLQDRLKQILSPEQAQRFLEFSNELADASASSKNKFTGQTTRNMIWTTVSGTLIYLNRGDITHTATGLAVGAGGFLLINTPKLLNKIAKDPKLYNEFSQWMDEGFPASKLAKNSYLLNGLKNISYKPEEKSEDYSHYRDQ